MTRKPRSSVFWRDEQAYIARIVGTKNYSFFNNDPDCFRRYATMQANFAEKDGFCIIASTIRASINDLGR